LIIAPLKKQFSVPLDKFEGILKRKNRHGEWKERYCQFTENQFVTYKTSKGKKTTEVKECYKLREIESAEIVNDQLVVTLYNGEKSLYKGDNIEEWENIFGMKIEEAAEKYQEKLVQESGSSNQLLLSGYLMKKSHNKYQGFQVWNFTRNILFFIIIYFSSKYHLSFHLSIL
jgi:hypothetical protein